MKVVKKLAFIFVLVVLLLLVNLKWEEKSVQADHEGGETAWYDPDWAARKHITIDNTQVSGDGDLTNFPVLVTWDIDLYLAARAQADADDIVFTSADGTTKLDHEIEKFDSLSGELTAWVEVPALGSATDTSLFMYYGNPEATSQENVEGTWNSDYSMVHHFSETSGQHIDSTSNNNDTDSVSVTTQGSADAKMGGADRIVGNPDLITIPDNDNNSLDKTGNLTLSMWIKPDGITSQYQAVFYKGAVGSFPRNYGLYMASDSNIRFLMTWYSGNWNSFISEEPLLEDEWNHMVYKRDETEETIFMNGEVVAQAAITQGMVVNDEKIRIGHEGGFPFVGNLDELRIIDTPLSDDWITTEYANQNSPATFYSVGSEELLGTSWYDGWSKRKSITVDADLVSGTGYHADYPVAISLESDADLAADAQDDGDDIVFTAVDGVTKLDHEIEYFDGSTGELVAWVKVPALMATVDTPLYMYYGNSGVTSQENVEGTWNSDYSMVHHFSETAGQHLDSTSNNNDTDYVSVTTQGTAESIIGGADRVVGNPDLITIPDNANGSLDKTGNFSLSIWVKPDALTSAYQAIFFKGAPGGPPRNYGLFITNINTILMTWYYGDWRSFSSDTTLVDDSWNHLVYTRSNTQDSLYLNGQFIGSWDITYLIEADDEKLYIGYENANIFIGSIDEFRIIDTPLSSDLIATEYNNLTSPSTFISLGSEEENAAADPPSISLTALSPDPTSDATPSLTGTATDTDGAISLVEFQVDSTSGSWTACVADDGTFDEASEAFTCTVSSELTEGSHTVYARATDNSDLISENDSDLFVVDITAPSISLTAVSPDPTSDTTPAIGGTVTDTLGIVTDVEFQIDSVAGSWTACVADDGTFDEASEEFTCTSDELADGAHTFYVRATDSASNTSSPSSDTFTVDTTVPSLDLTAVSPDPTGDTTPSLSGTATDETTTVASVQFQMNGTGGSWSNCTADDGAFDENTEAFTCTVGSPLDEDEHQMFVQAADVAGNVSSPSSDTFTIDVTGPEVSLTALSPDPHTDNMPSFSGTATDSGGTITAVEYQIDSTSGSWIECEADDSAFDESTEAFTCTVAELSDGAHTFYVRATDGLGVPSATESDTFTIDTVAPLLSLTAVSPDPGTDSTPTLTGTATDVTTTISAVQFQMNGTGGSWANCTADDGTFDEASEAFTCSVSSELSDGQNTIYVRATDLASLTSSPSLDAFVVDTTAPSLSLTAISPDPGTDSTPTLVGTATDVTTTISAVQFQMNGTGGSWINCSATDGTFDEASEEFNCAVASVLEDGSHQIYVRTLDVVENTSNASSDTFEVDTTGPVVSLTPLSPDPSTDTTPEIGGTATDVTTTVDLVEYQVDSTSGSWTACAADDGSFDEASEAFSCTVASVLSDGSHTLYVRSTDEVGNSSSIASDVFSIDTTAPVISSISVTPSDTSVTIAWNTNETSSSKVDYGLSADYGETTTETDTSPRVTAHSVTVSSLASCTTYHFRVRSVDSLTHEAISSDGGFTTTGCTGSAAVVSQTSEEVTTASGGSVELVSGSADITVTVPPNFADVDAYFQIKQLSQTAVINATSLPTGYILAGVHLYDLKALTDTSTVVSTFDDDLTVTVNYNASDVTDIIENTLQLYRWDGSTWHQLTDCNLDTSADTIACSTSEFSVFGLFGEEDSDVDEAEDDISDDDSGSSSSSSTADICTKASPGSKTPWLYGALTKSSSSIELHFTAADEPVTKYVLQYGTKSGQYDYGVQDLGVNSREQMKYIVQALAPNTTYYFRVRASNGCAVGDWSNEIMAKTAGYVSLNQLQFTESELEVVQPVENSLEVVDSPATDTPSETDEQAAVQHYKVSIKVLDDQGKPVEGAKVTMHSKVQEGYSDKNGLVAFDNVEKGAHRVIIAYQGYQGEQAINLDGEVEEISLTIHIKAQNAYLSPQFIIAMSISSVTILTLLVLLWKKSK